MIPINKNKEGCVSISSECVIWQNNAISCIDICPGDTVGNIVQKLGVVACNTEDQQDVSKYDLSCLKLPNCPPSDFRGLIQLLIAQICDLQTRVTILESR